MAFHPGVIAVFDRSGTRIGTLPLFTLTGPRDYRFNEIESLNFAIPYRDKDGNDIYTAAIAALLKRDNHIYVENELPGMEGWGGIITNITDGNDRVTVACISGLTLFTSLQAATIKQSEGTSSMIAGRLVGAAAAKQGAHGDLVPTLVVDGDTDMPGLWEYEGDILQGLQRLASDGLAEMYCEAVLAPDAQSIAYRLHWNAIAVSVDHTAVVLHDGAGGQVKSSPDFLYSGLEVVNHAKMKGIPTDLGQYVDYSSVRSIIRNITPEIEVTLDDPAYANYRRREDLNLSVNFGYPVVIQKAMSDDIQGRYIEYFKTYIYAYHFRQGKPYLEGFDWGGPDGSTETRLTEDRFRTLNKLGRIGAVTVITADSDMNSDTAAITEWSIDRRFNPPGMGNIAGVALDWADTSQHYLADVDGAVYLVADDYVTLEFWGTAPTGGGTVVGIATDPAAITTLWVAVSTGSTVEIRAYDVNSNALISSYTFAISGAGDIAVDYNAGLLYIVGTSGGGQVQVRDISSGALLSPDASFASGFAAPVGLTVSGGVAYIADASGTIRMLYTDTGHLAGDFNTGVPISGAMYADIENRRIYLSHGGDLSVYHAYVALATIGATGDVEGAPGFDSLVTGAFVHIVESSDGAYTPTHSASSFATHVVVHGDTLWALARRYYGSGSSWHTIYRANKATIDALARSHGFTGDFAHWIFPGESLHIPGVGAQSDPAPPKPKTKYLIVYTPGHWITQIEPGPVGEPALLQRSWEQTHSQVVGFVDSSSCVPYKPGVVIQGEEGRVDDWNPGRDGYGVYRHVQQYRTPKGHIKNEGPGWYPADWDVPESNWTMDQQPWPKGEKYLRDFLTKRNREVTVQSFPITNEGGVWSQVRRGATLTLQIALQGPVDAATTKVVRVLAYAPDEAAGVIDIVAEVWT